MHPRHIEMFGKGRDRLLILLCPHKRLVIRHGHHNVRQARADDLRLQALGAVRQRQAIGPVQLRPALPGQHAQGLGRCHVHPNGFAADADVQLPGPGMGGVGAIADAAQTPQQRKGRHRGVTAQVNLSGRRKVAQMQAILPLLHEYRLRMLQLRSHLLHHLRLQGLIRQHHSRLVASENPVGKGVHHIHFHSCILLIFSLL